MLRSKRAIQLRVLCNDASYIDEEVFTLLMDEFVKFLVIETIIFKIESDWNGQDMNL